MTAEHGSSAGGRVGPRGVASKRVLIVDDDADTAESLRVFLQREGHAVSVAYDGHAALVVACAERPEVVVLDIGLPGTDGYEVARGIRRESALAGVTLIALSGYGSDHHKRRSRDAGFDYHLVKPVEAEIVHDILAGDGPERFGPRRVDRPTDVPVAARKR